MLQSGHVAKRQPGSKSSKGVISLQAKLGATVRLWRNRLGITQEELAWRSDLHRTYIADIERGGRNITLRSIEQLALALEVSVHSLLASAESEGNSAAAKKGRKAAAKAMGEVLLVEDNAADVDLALRAFKRAKFVNPVKVVRDGAEALDYLLGTGQFGSRGPMALPQLVLLDLLLPKVSGLEVLRRMKENALTRSVPVVVLSGSHQDENIIECGRLGAENYIIKPLSFDSFCKVTTRLSLRWALLNKGAPGSPGTG
ncbi:MAG: response regulator [Verrucomicrobia bacterium]|nr:response regulator [Verrucomicrobiota bacterium]